LKRRRELFTEHQVRVRSTISRWTEALGLIDAKVEFYNEWVCDGERPATDCGGAARSAMLAWRHDGASLLARVIRNLDNGGRGYCEVSPWLKLPLCNNCLHFLPNCWLSLALPRLAIHHR
jgi:hypothetical protein